MGKQEVPDFSSEEFAASLQRKIEERLQHSGGNDGEVCPGCGEKHGTSAIVFGFSMDFNDVPAEFRQLRTLKKFIEDREESVDLWKGMFMASWSAANVVGPVKGLIAMTYALSLLNSASTSEPDETGYAAKDIILWYAIASTRNAANVEQAWQQALEMMV